MEQRRLVFREHPESKTGIWTLHLQRFLVTHPDLSDAQRSVIFEALGWLSTGAMSLPADSPDRDVLGVRPVKLIEQHASATFPPELARDAFFNLGPSPAPALGPPPAAVLLGTVDVGHAPYDDKPHQLQLLHDLLRIHDLWRGTHGPQLMP